MTGGEQRLKINKKAIGIVKNRERIPDEYYLSVVYYKKKYAFLRHTLINKRFVIRVNLSGGLSCNRIWRNSKGVFL
jgi:hypothetical protein